MDELKAKFNAAAAGRFGSGWAWLGVKKDGSLGITSTPNQAETRGLWMCVLSSAFRARPGQDGRLRWRPGALSGRSRAGGCPFGNL